jgi:hypothetical protein
VTLKDMRNRALWAVDIAPEPDAGRLQRLTSR